MASSKEGKHWNEITEKSEFGKSIWDAVGCPQKISMSLDDIPNTFYGGCHINIVTINWASTAKVFVSISLSTKL